MTSMPAKFPTDEAKALYQLTQILPLLCAKTETDSAYTVSVFPVINDIVFYWQETIGCIKCPLGHFEFDIIM